MVCDTYFSLYALEKKERIQFSFSAHTEQKGDTCYNSVRSHDLVFSECWFRDLYRGVIGSLQSRCKW